MLEKFINYLSKIMMVGFVFANFILQSIITETPMFELLKDVRSILYIVFSLIAQLISADTGIEDAINKGLETESFKEADETNNEIITYINNNFDETLNYISYVNDNERKLLEKNFLLAKGVNHFDKLSEKDLKEYNKLKPKIHSGKDINLPLYVEFDDGKIVSYATSLNAKRDKKKVMKSKVVMGLIFGLLSIDVLFRFSNISSALSSTIILSVGMLVAYGSNFILFFNKLSIKLPKQVKNKKVFYDGMLDYIKKNGGVAKKHDEKVILQLPAEYEDTNNGGE